jgi:hypothetical protein
MDWTIWLRIGTGGGLLRMRWWTFVFHKMRRISWVAYDVLASQERLSSVEYNVYNMARTYLDFPVWSSCKKRCSPLLYGVTGNSSQCQLCENYIVAYFNALIPEIFLDWLSKTATTLWEFSRCPNRSSNGVHLSKARSVNAGGNVVRGSVIGYGSSAFRRVTLSPHSQQETHLLLQRIWKPLSLYYPSIRPKANRVEHESKEGPCRVHLLLVFYTCICWATVYLRSSPFWAIAQWMLVCHLTDFRDIFQRH